MEFKKENGGRGVQMFQLNFTATGEVLRGSGNILVLYLIGLKKIHVPFFFPFFKKAGLKISFG